MRDKNNKELNPGDLIEYKQSDGFGPTTLSVFVRKIGKDKPFPEAGLGLIALDEMLYCIKRNGDCTTVNLSHHSFTIIKSGQPVNFVKDSEEIKCKELDYGDVIGMWKEYVSDRYVVVDKVLMGTPLKQYGLNARKKDSFVIKIINDKFPVKSYISIGTDITVYRYLSMFGANTSIKTKTLNTSLYNSICTLCGKPAYIGCGPMECSNINCAVNKK